ncbi:hypothetical protein [Aurantiacibacter rhizosphaerae]|uniref:Uncharacterized protein n=1 Tax=Aurantiacibacter rhizosphaerae TaxID=2691582 RepID=A0A844XAY2_9SPHN|nr:hypothetical protein [Aurantiacibacter rhizosphaerae]MWV27651.1 hypothetical protein [Aurantiacibacter rhizosphaerae]
MTHSAEGRKLLTIELEKPMRKITLLSAFALSLSACGGSDESSVQTDDGETIDYKVDTAGDDSEIRITGDDGEEMVINSSVGADVSLPDGFTVYPGATIVNSTVMNQSDGQGTLVIMQSDDSPEEMADFYRSQAEKSGIAIGMEASSNGAKMVAGESDDGATFSFNATSSGEGTTGQLVVGKGLN